MNTSPRTVSAPDYGIDAPGVVRTMAMIGGLMIGGALVMRVAMPGSAQLARTLLWPGASFAISAVLMVASSKFGKLRARDRVLDALSLQGTETVLDVGCGHGLMLIGAARRLSKGQAIGVDLWSQTDQYANSPEATIANAAAEGVGDHVTVKSGDMRQLPLPDASVDVIVSSLAIHNVPTAAERTQAIHEIDRVARPGARVGILDIAHVGDYRRVLEQRGWRIVRSGFTPWIFPPTRELIAEKPAR